MLVVQNTLREQSAEEWKVYLNNHVSWENRGEMIVLAVENEETVRQPERKRINDLNDPDSITSAPAARVRIQAP